MIEDPRCCGSGTCMIDPEGRCWCGQQWNGQKMAAPPLHPQGAQIGVLIRQTVDPDIEPHP